MTQTSLHTGLGARLISSSSTATSKPFSSLPIISLAALSSPHASDGAFLAGEIQKACMESGFFYIVDHGVSAEVLENVWREAKGFFDQSEEKKMLVDMHKGTSFKGYLPLKGEQVDPSSHGDLHEAFDIGSDNQSFSDGKITSGNQFPPADDLPNFKPALMEAWDSIMDLGKRLFPLFALALDLPENYFDQHLTNPGSIMRILHYPPQEGVIDSKEIGIGAHTDYECFTLLCQDGVSALQVLNNAGEWIKAPPIEGAIICNLGDQLQRWSNDVFKSTVHRAINTTGRERYSMPFFFGTNYDTLIEAIPTCVSEARPAKYAPIKAGEWVESRLAETYVKSEK